MAVYDLEEQDQIEDLKAWWVQWGNHVTLVVTAVCIAIAGVQGWRWWQHSQAEQASTLIQPLIQAMSFGLGVREMARGQYWIHPALTEVVENALLHLPLD